MHDFRALPHQDQPYSNGQTIVSSHVLVEWDMTNTPHAPQTLSEIETYVDPSQIALKGRCSAPEAPMLSINQPDAFEKNGRMYYRVKGTSLFLPNMPLCLTTALWLKDVMGVELAEEYQREGCYYSPHFCPHAIIDLQIDHYVFVGNWIEPRWRFVKQCFRPECEEEDTPF